MARSGTAAVPGSPTQLADALSSPAWVNKIFDDPHAFGEFEAAYQRKMMASGEIQQQVREQAQALMVEELRATRGPGGSPLPIGGSSASPSRSATARRHHLFSARAPGAGINHLADRDPDAMAKAFMAVAGRGRLDPSEMRRISGAMQNAMSERVPGQGGFLVPENLRSEVLLASLEHSIIRPRARIIPMDSLRVPYPSIDDQTHTSSVLGGLTGYWSEEAATLTASQPGFGRIVLEAKKLALYTEIPNELVNDAPTLTSFLQMTLPMACAFYEDLAFISGSGVGQPQGYINAPGAIKVSRKTASKVKFEDIAALYPRMLPVAMQNAIWVCSPSVIGQLLQLVMPTGDATVTYVAGPLWLTAGSVAPGAQYTLLGHPLFVTEKAAALGSTGDLAFVNLDYYLLGDRQTMTLTSSEHFKFSSDLLAVRLLERLDGRIWIQSAVTPQNGDSTLSPVVLLQ
jgi:HK97 family phage major capsid protein